MNYVLKLAKIYKFPDWSDYDDRLFVQITPEMDDITENLPCWPYFFRDEQFKGNVGDLVWVICDDEYSVGYILGPANYFSYPEDEETYKQYSIQQELKTKVSDILVNLKLQQLNFFDIKVTFWNDTCIHFIERSTGGLIIAYSVGTIFVMRPTEFMVRFNENTAMVLNADGFSVVGESIKLQSNDVELGKNPANRVVTTSGVEGSVNTVSDSVKA